MMRLPRFRYRAPASTAEAVAILAGEGPAAMPLAGGTDLLPNMKRRQQVPATLVALRRVAGLRDASLDGAITLGAGLTLTELVRRDALRERAGALWQAAAQVATPQLRSMATLGGNLCLDTRCTFYDQTEAWRRAIGYCMKKDGETCWVAPSSPRCLAVSSTDTAPALIALGARVRLVGPEGERELPVAALYRNDGMDYIARGPDELVTAIEIDDPSGWRSCYWKLRRRGSFDFPVLGVAAALRLGAGGAVEAARISLGAVASRPLVSDDAAATLVGREPTDAAIAEAAELAAVPAKPMDNTDFTLQWRKRAVRELVTDALRELRGDDVRERRRRIARHELGA